MALIPEYLTKQEVGKIQINKIMKRLILVFVLSMTAFTGGVFAQDSLKVHIKGFFPKGIYKIYWFDKIYELHTKDKQGYLYTFWVTFPDSVKEGNKFSFKIDSRKNRCSSIKTENFITCNFSNTKKYFFLLHDLDSSGNDAGFQTEWRDSICYEEEKCLLKSGFYDFNTINPYFLPNITYDNLDLAEGKKIIRRRNAKHHKNNGLLR